jgi:hypothetical protein
VQEMILSKLSPVALREWPPTLIGCLVLGLIPDLKLM